MTSLAGITLAVPAKLDVERDAVALAWQAAGGLVVRVERFWEPPDLDPTAVRIYGPEVFSMILAQKLGVALSSPDDALIAALPETLLKRELEVCTLSTALAERAFPLFAKPVVPKQFAAAVYPASDALASATAGLPGATLLIIAEPVDIEAEVRAFVLNGQPIACAVYEGDLRNHTLADVRDLVTELCEAVAMPPTFVVDLAVIAGRGLAVLEFNASWGAGLNGCEPAEVLPAIAAATTTQ